jgi:nucleoside-diphosphate-sugar epimerase
MDRNDLILVTGASGFIGGRLVELLAERGLRVRAAISNASKLSRISQLDVERVRADLTDHAALSHAVAACSVIFHVAYRFGGSARQQRINLDATRALAEAFLKQGGRRFVHVSSMSAYGDPHDGELTEETPQRPTREPYSATKQNIERLLLDLHQTRGLPVTILQPAIVYGPYGSIWTTPLLEQVRSMRVVLPRGGLGICNAVYVDDVVSALMLAADCDAAVGESFLVSGASSVTWREFYGAYEKMLGRTAVVDLDEAQLRIVENRWRRPRHSSPVEWLLAGVRRLLPGPVKATLKRGLRSLQGPQVAASDAEPPLFMPDGLLHALYASKTHIRIDKARKIFGYKPAFDLDKGMARTAEWARQANLLAR